jgi:membrane fusion protein (multidrug efflux system)
MRTVQQARIEVDALGGREFKGHIDSMAAATGAKFSLLPPENATGNYVKVVQRVPVKIVLEAGQDPEHLLRPGMSVIPTVYTK